MPTFSIWSTPTLPLLYPPFIRSFFLKIQINWLSQEISWNLENFLEFGKFAFLFRENKTAPHHQNQDIIRSLSIYGSRCLEIMSRNMSVMSVTRHTKTKRISIVTWRKNMARLNCRERTKVWFPFYILPLTWRFYRSARYQGQYGFW